MAVRVVRLGSPRVRYEGLRIGTVRRPPRGVKKSDYKRLNYYDTWLPALAPSAELVQFARRALTDADWNRFKRSYRKEMSTPASRELLDLLAVLSHETNFSVGCYCEDESHCHRSVLRELLAEHGAKLAD